MDLVEKIPLLSYFQNHNMNSTMDEITSNNTTAGKYDFAEFDKMDLVNVLTYLVISISKYWNIISKINTE